MRHCVEAVFRVTATITSEPEAALGHVLRSGVALGRHIVLIDGGDGTFDHLYAKRCPGASGAMWYRRCQRAFTCAGAQMYR